MAETHVEAAATAATVKPAARSLVGALTAAVNNGLPLGPAITLALPTQE